MSLPHCQALGTELQPSPGFAYWAAQLCYFLFDDVFDPIEISAQPTLHVFLKCLVQESRRFFFLTSIALTLVLVSQKGKKKSNNPNSDLLP